MAYLEPSEHSHCGLNRDAACTGGGGGGGGGGGENSYIGSLVARDADPACQFKLSLYI